jgi:hypothetical protein
MEKTLALLMENGSRKTIPLLQNQLMQIQLFLNQLSLSPMWIR